MNKLICRAGVALLLMVAIVSSQFARAEESAAKPDEAAVNRARKTVKMLDTIYKNAVVLITDKYVHEEDDFPAGSAAVALFKAVSDGGSHQVRLLDVSGQPYDAKNVAKDKFEKSGVKALQGGAADYEKVVQMDGKYQLRAMTAIPVVMQKCVMCHPNYADAKEGAAIGAISYTIPIE